METCNHCGKSLQGVGKRGQDTLMQCPRCSLHFRFDRNGQRVSWVSGEPLTQPLEEQKEV